MPGEHFSNTVLTPALGQSVPSRPSMHAMACLTADVRVPQSACTLFFSLGGKAQNTRLSARKRLFWATGVSDAEQPAPLCSRKACSHGHRSPLAVLAPIQPVKSDGLVICARRCADCLCLIKHSNALTPVAFTVGAWGSSTLAASVIV